MARFGDVRAKTVVFLKTVKQGGVLKASVPIPHCSVYALGIADPPRLYLGARNYMAAAETNANTVGASAVAAGVSAGAANGNPPPPPPPPRARDDGATRHRLPRLPPLTEVAVREPVPLPLPAPWAAKLANEVTGGAATGLDAGTVCNEKEETCEKDRAAVESAAGTDTVCEGKAEACGKTVGTVESVDGAKTESDDHKRGRNEEDGDGEGGVKKKLRQDAAGAGKGTAGTIYKG